MSKNKPKFIGTGAWVNPKVSFGKNVWVGHCSCIGYPEKGENRCKIMDGVKIGAYCVVSMGSVLGKNVKLEHYCRVDTESKIGHHTQLLYGARVHWKVRIGNNCCIGGNCPDRTVIGNNVQHFGRLVHIPKGGPWNSTEDPSPFIDDGVFIGANALIIGGVKIGKKTRVGANALIIGNKTVIGEGCKIDPLEIVTESLKPNTHYSHGKKIPIRKRNDKKR